MGSTRGLEVYPIGPPTPEEASHPFMWRFGNRVPGPGQSAVFDRSWDDRRLVERVEQELSDSHYESSIHKINVFERMLQSNQIILVTLCLETDRETHRSLLLR